MGVKFSQLETHGVTYSFAKPNPPTYELHITDSFCIQCVGKAPSKWNQFWMKKFFGFKVKEINVQ